MIATYGDLGDLRATVFYKYKNGCWEKLWGRPDLILGGFFKVDGEFCVTYNGSYWLDEPGPLPAKRVINFERI